MQLTSEDVYWMLKNISVLGDKADRKTIFRGCYDVWFCEQDRIDSVEIPKQRLAAARDQGLIEEVDTGKKYPAKIWRLTENGKKMLEDLECQGK